jgi:hypothetical protein
VYGNLVALALGVAVAVGAGCASSESVSGDAGERTSQPEGAAPGDDAGKPFQGGSPTTSQRHRAITIQNFGIQLSLPAGWDGRMFLTSPGDIPNVHAASFALPANDSELEFGKRASRLMRASDIRVRLLELPSVQLGTQGFNATKLPIKIRRSDIKPSPWIPADHAHVGRRFAVHGRPFSLGVEFGRKPPTANQWRAANRVIASLAIDSRPELDPAQWRPLRRQLRLPRDARGASCPRSRSTRAAPRVGWTLGPGPAYPVIGSANGIAGLKDDLVKSGWYLHKTLWAISPLYRGPLLIRGDRIDATGALRFQSSLSSELKLHRLPAATRSRWRYVPSYTALRGAGCFAFQVDGARFSVVIVFEATTAS